MVSADMKTSPCFLAHVSSNGPADSTHTWVGGVQGGNSSVVVCMHGEKASRGQQGCSTKRVVGDQRSHGQTAPRRNRNRRLVPKSQDAVTVRQAFPM